MQTRLRRNWLWAAFAALCITATVAACSSSSVGRDGFGETTSGDVAFDTAPDVVEDVEIDGMADTRRPDVGVDVRGDVADVVPDAGRDVADAGPAPDGDGGDTGFDADGHAGCSQAQCEVEVALEPCQRVWCDEPSGACRVGPLDDESACDDGNPCTDGDVCRDGACRGVPRECEGATVCTPRVCDVQTGGCVGVPLADGEPCGATPPGGCVAPRCAAGVCVDEPLVDGSGCDDGDACTVSDVCGAGVCAGQPRVCDDGNPCTEDECLAGSGLCEYRAAHAGEPCDDGRFCTVDDRCVAGVCDGSARTCDDDVVCTEDSCDEEAGACRNDAAAVEGFTCDDGDACTFADRCESGACVGTARACDDGNACTADRCDGGTGDCVYDPAAQDGLGCDDGDPCTDGDLCDDGVCAGAPIRECCVDDGDCDDGLGCTEESCGEDGRCVRGSVCEMTDGCTTLVCMDDGTCGLSAMERPLTLWRTRYGDASHPRAGGGPGLRAWPPSDEPAWTPAPGQGRHGAAGLVVGEGVATTLYLPPVALPPGVVTFELWVAQGAGSCPEGTPLLELERDGLPLAALACGDAGWRRLVVPVGAAQGETAALSVRHPATAAATLGELRLVHRGVAGCSLGAPQELDGADDATHLALAAGPGDGATIAWAVADRMEPVRVAAPLALAESPETRAVSSGDSMRSEFALDLARVGDAVAVCWGAEGTSGHSVVALWEGDGPLHSVEIPTPDSTGRANTPTIAPAVDGGWQVVWQGGGGDSAFTKTGRWSREGEELIPQEILTFGGPYGQDLVSMADGTFALLEMGRSAGRESMFVQPLDVDGRPTEPVPTWVHMVQTEVEAVTHASVTVLTDGGFVAAWQEDSAETDAADVLYRRYDGDWQPLADAASLAAVTAGDQTAPAVAALPGGGFVAVWASNDHNLLASRLVYREFGVDGPVRAEQEAVAFAGDATRHVSPGVERLDDGRVLIAWRDELAERLSYTTLPAACGDGWWRCEPDATVSVCGPDGYLPLLGEVVDGTAESPVCP